MLLIGEQATLHIATFEGNRIHLVSQDSFRHRRLQTSDQQCQELHVDVGFLKPIYHHFCGWDFGVKKKSSVQIIFAQNRLGRSRIYALNCPRFSISDSEAVQQIVGETFLYSRIGASS